MKARYSVIALCLLLALVPANLQAQTKGHSSGGMHRHGADGTGHDEVNMPGLRGQNATPEESAELAVMFRNFDTITREVTNLPNGIRSVTRSSDEKVMAALVSHVGGMIGRVESGDDPQIMIQSPTLDIFFARGDKIKSEIDVTDERGGAHVRCEGDNNEVRFFKTFAPAALAGIGSLPGTLADRSVYVKLKKRLASEPLSELTETAEAYLRTLASQAARWVDDNQAALNNSRPAMPHGAINRVADNYRPLVAIANAAGGDWPDRISAAIRSAVKEDAADSIGVRLLRDMKTIFEQTGKDRIQSDALPDLLKEIEDGGWAEFGKREAPITKTQITRILSQYGISSGPHRGWPAPKEVRRGFLLEHLEDAFARYLPSQSVTALQPNVTNGFSDSQSVTPELPVTLQKPPKPALTNGCNSVTLQKGETGQGAEDDLTPPDFLTR